MNSAVKQTILFLCTGNSCRSQMAEAWTNHLKGHIIDAYSAGIEPKRVDQRAIRAMSEVGVDISAHKSKVIKELEKNEFDYVITLCDHAQKTCPFYPAKTSVLHRAFADPPKLAENARTEEEAMKHYRRIRDEIKDFIEQIPECLLSNLNNKRR